MLNPQAQIKALRKTRRMVRVIVTIGIAVSVATNVFGALGDHVAEAIAGWPPVALMLSLEVLTRVPNSKRWGAFGRVTATIGVGFAAGWLSYWHMAATVSQHGEHGGSQYIWPISVDGLMTIAAIALVELGARLRALELSPDEAARVTPEQARVTPEPVVQAQQVVQAEVTRLPTPVSPAPARRATPDFSDRTPIPRRPAMSPLTGRVLTERPPLK